MNSRDKGKRGEREAAKVLADVLGCQAKRGVQYQGGTDSPDVVHTIPDMHIEVKRCERVQIHQWMEQSVRDAGGSVPTVLHRKNGTEWLLTLRLIDAPRLAQILAAATDSLPETLGD